MQNTGFKTHGNAFAGLSGSTDHSLRPVAAPITNTDSNLLVDPHGRWAMRLSLLEADMAHMLIQILRDLAPPATQMESAFIRQVAELDVAARQDHHLVGQVERGLAALDTLARKLTKRRYIDVPERTLRRTLLSQITEQPLMDRLGVRTPAYASAAL